MKTRHIIVSLSLLVCITSCTREDEDLSTFDTSVDETALENQPFIEDFSHLAPKSFSFLPDEITFTAPGLYPEGIEFDFRRNQFYVGSLSQGTIGIVTNAGEYTPFIEDEILTSSIGIHIDNLRDRLYVAIGSLFANIAGIASYDLKTGNRILYVDLVGLVPGATPFPNDLITDFKGNVYVTDSSTSVIYKIDTKGNASVFLEDEALVPSVGFGLNGITYHPFGFLLVATSDAKFFRIPIRDPESFVTIDLEVGGFDGLQIIDFKTVYAVSGSANVLAFRSKDAWKTVKQTDTYMVAGDFPTTLANAYFRKAYVINSSLDDFIAGADPAVETFTIERVDF